MVSPGHDQNTEKCSLTLSAESILVHMRIPAERLYVGNAMLTLREICDHLDLAIERANKIVLSLEEALLNAIEHAYCDSRGLIDLHFSVEGSDFIVVVEDYGCGLTNFSEFLDVSDEKILCERGRGLSILHGIADKTVVQSLMGRGTRATMLFHLAKPKAA